MLNNLFTYILPCGDRYTLGADEIVEWKIRDVYSGIVVLNAGEVTYQLILPDDEIPFKEDSKINEVLKKSIDELPPYNRTVKEIAIHDDILYLRLNSGICLQFMIVSNTIVAGEPLDSIGSLNGGVHKFENQYIYDRGENTTAPIIGNHTTGLHANEYVVIDGDFIKIEADGSQTIVESGVSGGGKIEVGRHDKDFEQIQGADGKVTGAYSTPQKAWIEENGEFSVSGWAGVGDLGYYIDRNSGIQNVSIAKDDRCLRDIKELIYYTKDNKIFFPYNPEIIPTQTTNIFPKDMIGKIYSEDTTNKFYYSILATHYHNDNFSGLNLGYRVSPWAEFDSWVDLN